MMQNPRDNSRGVTAYHVYGTWYTSWSQIQFRGLMGFSVFPLYSTSLTRFKRQDKTNAPMGRVDRNWTKSGERPSPMARGFVSRWACACPTLPGMMTFRVAISTETDPQGTGRVDIHTHPYTTAACPAGVVTETTDRDSLRYTYNGTRRVCQLALGCERNWVKSTLDAYENTWKGGELKLYFSSSAGG